MSESVADAFPDVQCQFCGGTMRLQDRGGEAEWEASYMCLNKECGIEIVIEFDRDSRGYQADRPKPGFLEKLARRTPPPATAEVMLGTWFKTSAQGPEPVLYIPERLIVAMRAEWSETQGGNKP